MTFLGGQATYQPARQALGKLTRDVVFSYDNIHDVPEVHSGRKFKSAAVRFAIKAEKIEAHFTPRVHAVAAKITELCNADPQWAENNGILTLWHQLAIVVTHFSEHPTKPVASLIVSSDGVLQAFSSNRVPEGIARQGIFYVKGIRKNFIVCSERMAVARLLQLRVRLPDAKKVPKSLRLDMTRNNIKQLTTDIAETGKTSAILHKSLIMSTITMCEVCARAIIPFKPSAIYAPKGSGKHFTRSPSFKKTQELLDEWDVAALPLPKLG